MEEAPGGRGLLMLFLALDLFVMGGSGYFVWQRVQKTMNGKAPAAVAVIPPAQTAAPTKTPEAFTQNAKTPAAEMKQEIEDKPAAPAAKRSGPLFKKTFRYRDFSFNRVHIAGSFNQWSPQEMRKDNHGFWTVTLILKPGEYYYNFIVDGRMIRDPSNPKSKKAGQKIASSVLTVKKK